MSATHCTRLSSVTAMPGQTASISSSLLTIRPAFAARCRRTANACGRGRTSAIRADDELPVEVDPKAADLKLVRHLHLAGTARQP
jgi:hypothetical protein